MGRGPAEVALQHPHDLPGGGVGAGGVDCGTEQLAVAELGDRAVAEARRGGVEAGDGALVPLRVAAGAELTDPLDGDPLDIGVDLEDLALRLPGGAVAVEADDLAPPEVDELAPALGGVLDNAADEAVLLGGDVAALGLDLLDQLERGGGDRVGQRLDVVRARRAGR